MASDKLRLDQLLVLKGYYPSREQSKRVIMAGLVYCGDKRLDKPGLKLSQDTVITVKDTSYSYVSRGGQKLEKGLKTFSVSVEDRIVADIGASTGGFTDCLLTHGAKHVYAIDVGYGQLDWKLRQEKRVTVLEKTNIRYVSAELFNPCPDMATIDVSFISLKLVLPKMEEIIKHPRDIIMLIKPQFEAERHQVGKKGVVKNPETHIQVLTKILAFAQENFNYFIGGLTYSPITGPEGNIEFLAHITKCSKNLEENLSIDEMVDTVVDEAHSHLNT